MIKYIDKDLNTSANGIDYSILDNNVVAPCKIFEREGDTYLAFPDDSQEALSLLFKRIDVKVYIQTKGNQWKFERVDSHVLAKDIYISEALDQTFGHFDLQPYNEQGELKENLVSEAQFFLNLAKGKYQATGLTIFAALENLLNNLYAND